MAEEPLVPYSWSSSLLDDFSPRLTSSLCSNALSSFFSNITYLSVATEASSHPSGLQSLYAQPWLYAGGGLGNIDECPLQTCLAGAGLRRDSITFASVCVVPECTAHDLIADDFVGTAYRVATETADIQLSQEYVTSLERISRLNKFLGTGWTCGDFLVPWNLYPFGYLFLGLSIVLVAATIYVSSVGTPSPTRTEHSIHGKLFSQNGSSTGSLVRGRQYFSATDHVQRLLRQHSSSTAVLDGLRVISLAWIILGHTMAIMSSSGAGYKNPGNFLPPDGLTNTVIGQLLFSSRYAVDTFLCISGFLLVQVISLKFPPESGLTVFRRMAKKLPTIMVGRVGRILPVYLMSLGFYTQVAPHLGKGPFWYQWLGLLKPCHDYGWTNLLFVNNFIPWDIPVTETCFYHSWYLAVDMQLFPIGVLFVFVYQADTRLGKWAALGAILLSSVLTAYLSFVREWSINTFDGAAVSRFEVEAYAKPHVRAQAYFSGMLVAMLLPDQVLERRSPWTWTHRVIIAVALLAIATVTFVTAWGAYGRRACQYQEWPATDACGSLWSSRSTFLYTAFARLVWSTAISVLMYVCLGRDPRENWVSRILSWRCWVPLSHLSFAAYLIHPIVIFVWQLADREKETFRLFTFVMNYVAVSFVSFAAALMMWILVEMPFANLLKSMSGRPRRGRDPVVGTGEASNEEERVVLSGRGEYGSLPLSAGSG